MMEPHLQDLLAELHEWGRAHDELEQVGGKKMRNLMPEAAQFISMLVRSSRRSRLLEIGTSNGYSTIWLAWSARAQGGRVTSVDLNEEKLAKADANLQRAGLRHFVDLEHGDAIDVVRRLPGPFDFVFFDCIRARLEVQLELLLPKLADDVLIVADNVLSHAEHAAPFLAAIGAQAAFTHQVIPVGKGLSLAFRSARQ